MDLSSVRVIEFFSGIGGMRLALPDAPFHSHVAWEVSPRVNPTYRHNFPGSPLVEKLVEHAKGADLDGQSDLWLLSPPCQPYTATINAKNLQGADKRASGFHYLIEVRRTTLPPATLIPCL
jgi:tRNA (cytosine38-C5)-methyltransferase